MIGDISAGKEPVGHDVQLTGNVYARDGSTHTVKLTLTQDDVAQRVNGIDSELVQKGAQGDQYALMQYRDQIVQSFANVVDDKLVRAGSRFLANLPAVWNPTTTGNIGVGNVSVTTSPGCPPD